MTLRDLIDKIYPIQFIRVMKSCEQLYAGNASGCPAKIEHYLVEIDGIKANHTELVIMVR